MLFRSHVHIDLAGPIDVRRSGVVTRKNTGTTSVYIFLAVCRYSGALFLDVLQSYATDAVILALRKLSATHRLPEFVTSDRGTNLCGGKRILDEILSNTEFKFDWQLVPTGAHHFVGTVERQVSVVKRLLQKKLKSQTATFNELLVLCLEVARIINSRPLTYKTSGESDELWRIITPAHLLGNQPQETICNLQTGGKESITKRLRHLEGLQEQFWKSYREEILPELLKADRWRTERNVIAPGDMVLVDLSNELTKKLVLGRVEDVKPGGRTAGVRYRKSKDVEMSTHEVSTRHLLKIQQHKED